MKRIGRILSAIIIFVAIFSLLTACALEKREVDFFADMPEQCIQKLKHCFGEEYVLSEGVEKEEHFFDEYENRDIVTHYTEWELTYQDIDGEKHSFVFNNRNGRMDADEYLEESMENYFSALVQEYYKQNFWNQAVAGISGFRDADSNLYFRSYQLFSMRDVPETSVMFDERLHYSLAEHIYFPKLQYDKIFREFPYILKMYLCADYESADEEERIRQQSETEEKLRKMADEMILYTNGTFNAIMHVTMMDEDGYADGFSFGILNGEYFEEGVGLEYEIALHENFFGRIEE